MEVPDPVGKYLRTSKFNSRLLTVIIVAVIADMLEFYDFGLLSVVIPTWLKIWSLTGIETGLLVSIVGVGGVIGAFVFPVLGDRIGRRPVFTMTLLLVAISTGLIALTPERNIPYVLVMRFIQGVGIGATYSVDYTLLQEFAPEKYRGFIAGITSALLPLGTSLASLTGYIVLPIYGWRGLFAIGVVPALVSLAGRLLMPETPRWLYSHGKIKECTKSLSWIMNINDQNQVSRIEEDLQSEFRNNPVKKISVKEQLSILVSKSRAFSVLILSGFVVGFVWYLIVPYMPTFLALNYNISTVAAAGLFTIISLSGMFGRFAMSALVDILGRKWTIRIFTIIPFIFLLLTGTVLGTSLFLPLILPAYFVIDSIWSAVFVYANDLYPARSRASMSGLTYTSARFASIISPTLLGFYLGTPPSILGLFPLFAIAAVLYIIMSIVYWAPITPETKGRELTA